MNQKSKFVEYEGNSWFERNRAYATEYYSSQNDIVIELLHRSNIHPSKVLEIGCSSGYRLNAISLDFNCKCFGVEPSSQAREFAESKYPNISIIAGTADDLSMFENAQFDCIIIGFIFYVVDREYLFKIMSEVDRVLSNNGVLIIQDFYSPNFEIVDYKHVEGMSTFKMNYSNIFVSTNLYKEVASLVISHDINSNYFVREWDKNTKTSLLIKSV
jgi:ubiquinone/menaquinone biosynthesis C-methylase UbiE